MDFPILSPMLGATVSIDENDERLRITDPRPTYDMALSLVILIIALALVFSPLLPDSIWSSIVAAIVFLFFLYRLLTIPFREVYVFDKKANQYHLQRQSIFRSQTFTFDTRQISAMQVEHIETRSDYGNYGSTAKNDHYRTVFLMSPDLLLGMPMSQPIRESSLLFSDNKTEARIASAIAKYLGVRFDDNVDKATFA